MQVLNNCTRAEHSKRFPAHTKEHLESVYNILIRSYEQKQAQDDTQVPAVIVVPIIFGIIGVGAILIIIWLTPVVEEVVTSMSKKK